MRRFNVFTLVEVPEVAGSRQHNSLAAFTLAEVLITLAIIGVVAAVTIPTLVKNYQEKVTVTKVKWMYSILSQAYKFYLAENDKAEYIYVGEEGSAERVFKIFEPYLKISEDCTKNGTKNCFYFFI